ncbi:MULTISPECIES: hypothetical protein [Nostocales]|uniref:Uncharacterized protein n=1 Tax=Dolichospermum flos-aquae UHCC 0037 TaxID=2590026 RepID=A0ACC7S6X9_DOLFA|nr:MULTISPECIES: hypothetical protein [Nostocales]MBO1066960.1 hypothetical protein [Anabaena sp. 54]MTJ44263.1 hypothetical protein [Dolichospermum flos-aquae UHCC 0037]
MISEIYELFKKINQQAQITRVAQFMEMPNDLRPSTSMQLYEAKTAIVDWAEGSENGQEYRLQRLNKLKNAIENVIGEKNLPSNNSLEQSVEDKCANLLLSLNCYEQVDSFCNVLNSQSGGAFLIQANQEEIQRWLVKRLVNSHSKFTTAKKFFIKTQKHNMRYDFNNFWTEFNSICENPNRKSVINGLTNLCQTQSIIITIYDLRLLTETNKRSFYDFWRELWISVHSLKQRYFLVLLLVEEHNYNCSLLSPFQFVSPSNESKDQQNILLPPLEKISQDHVRMWLKREEVRSQINSIYAANEEYLNYLDYHVQWEQNEPIEMLEAICKKAFNMKNGIVTIEHYL